MSPTKPREQKEIAPDALDRARRKLLQIGIYSAPAVIGTLLIPRQAQAQTTSCQPYLCAPAPCAPKPCEPTPCNPSPCKPSPCSPQPCAPAKP